MPGRKRERRKRESVTDRLYASTTLSRAQKSGMDPKAVYLEREGKRRSSIAARKGRGLDVPRRREKGEMKKGTREKKVERKKESPTSHPTWQAAFSSPLKVARKEVPIREWKPVEEVSVSGEMEEKSDEMLVLEGILRQRDTVRAFSQDTQARLREMQLEAEVLRDGVAHATIEHMHRKAAKFAEEQSRRKGRTLSRAEADAVRMNVLRMKVAEQERRIREKEEKLAKQREEAQRLVHVLDASLRQTKALREDRVAVQRRELVSSLRAQVELLEKEFEEGEKKRSEELEKALKEARERAVRTVDARGKKDGGEEASFKRELLEYATQAKRRVALAAKELKDIADPAAEKVLQPLARALESRALDVLALATDAEEERDGLEKELKSLLLGIDSDVASRPSPRTPTPLPPKPISVYRGSGKDEIASLRLATLDLWRGGEVGSVEEMERFFKESIATAGIARREDVVAIQSAFKDELSRLESLQRIASLKSNVSAIERSLTLSRSTPSSSSTLSTSEFTLLHDLAAARNSLSREEEEHHRRWRK